MKLAVALIANAPAQHFGKANDFKIITIENKKIIESYDLHNETHVHQARPQFLKDLGVNALICDGMGSGALERLLNAEIEVYGFNNHSLGDAVSAFIEGKLPKNADVFECKC